MFRLNYLADKQNDKLGSVVFRRFDSNVIVMNNHSSVFVSNFL